MYKIDFKLNHTVIQTTSIMLDAVLAKVWLQQNHPELFSNKPAYSKDELFDFVNSDFPIEFDKEVGCFMASQIFLTGNVQEFVTSEKKRWNESNQWRLSDKEMTAVDTQRSTYKSQNIPRAGYVATSAVAWFCGDADKVAELLKNVIGIGKKVSKGYGWLRSVEISECEDDFWSQHRRTTPIICAKKLNFAGQILNIRLLPPYHQFIDAVPCVCPNIFFSQE